MSAISINHVSIHAHDLDTSAKFYEQLFGMERIEVDWPDARTLDPRIRQNLILLSATVHQTRDALRATLYLNRQDAPRP